MICYKAISQLLRAILLSRSYFLRWGETEEDLKDGVKMWERRKGEEEEGEGEEEQAGKERKGREGSWGRRKARKERMGLGDSLL